MALTHETVNSGIESFSESLSSYTALLDIYEKCLEGKRRNDFGKLGSITMLPRYQ